MGAQVSTNTAKRKEAVIRGVQAECEAEAMGSQELSIGSIGTDCFKMSSESGRLKCMELQAKQTELCGPREINITQDATVKAFPYCKTAQKGISEELSKMKNESQNGLGWGVTTTTTDKEKQIKDIVETNCKSKAQMTQSIDIGSFTKCGDLDLYQNMDLKAQCAAEAINAAMSKRIDEVGNKGKGWGADGVFGTLFGTGGGGTMNMVIFMIVLLVIGYVVLQVL